MREPSEEIGGHDAASCPPISEGKPIIQGDTLEEVWALKDVSFDIRRGEAVGIIDRNGAEKCTLLKILSRITEPSTGRVTIEGRVASLLEVRALIFQNLIIHLIVKDYLLTTPPPVYFTS